MTCGIIQTWVRILALPYISYDFNGSYQASFLLHVKLDRFVGRIKCDKKYEILRAVTMISD